jgi:hypothetical protein
MALDVIEISDEGLAAYVVPECRTGRPQAGQKMRKGVPVQVCVARRLTLCEAFLLRLGRKALRFKGLRW